MTNKIFEHVDIDLGYNDLDAKTTDKGRRYETPEGKQYPSVTTVVSIINEQAIKDWRKRVGEEEANRISHHASQRGTKVHDVIERYLKNEKEELYLAGCNPIVRANFNSVLPVLNERLGKIYAQEVALYSDHLGLAGRVDCIAEWDGRLSIVDWKTAAKPKKSQWIQSYYMQEAAYAIMWEERTGMPITQLVTVVAVDNHEPQVFIEHRDNWTETLHHVIDEYKRRKATAA